MDLKRFDVGKGRGVLEWLISLDEPGSEDRRTVTLNQIIEKARACFADFPWEKRGSHSFLESSEYPGKCVNASESFPNSVCWQVVSHPDHDVME